MRYEDQTLAVGKRLKGIVYAWVFACPVLAMLPSSKAEAQGTDKLVSTGLSYNPRQNGVAYDKVGAGEESRCIG
jgi:hypothetical protein